MRMELRWGCWSLRWQGSLQFPVCFERRPLIFRPRLMWPTQFEAFVILSPSALRLPGRGGVIRNL